VLRLRERDIAWCWALFLTRVSGNDFDAESVCCLVLSFLNMPSLSEISLDLEPIICIRSSFWSQAGLAIPPDEFIDQTQRSNWTISNWRPFLEYLRAGPYVRAHELRLMFIGDGEVGKTRLMQAFFAEEHKAEHNPTHVPTVGIDFKPWVFPSSDSGPAVTCQLCDFAGQESYYLSHSLHFSRRSLYLLMWTPYKFSPDGSPRLLDKDAEIVGPLKRWLQLLSDNVPEANVVVVGTHYSVNPHAFDALQTQVDQEISHEIDRLGHIAQWQASETQKVLLRQEKKVKDILTELTSLNLPIRAPQPQADEVAQFCKTLKDMRPRPNRSLRLQADALQQAVLDSHRTKRRLSRMYGLYDGSVPSPSSEVAHLKLVSSSQDLFKSFVVDSIEGVGVADLLRAIEATCRSPGALPFMGEQIPVSWLQVKAALQLQPVRTALGDLVLPLADAVAKLSSVLKTELGVDVALARRLNARALHGCIVNFWSPLGEVFVHDGHFLRDPRLIIDFLKPLVHHKVNSRAFWTEFCANPNDDSFNWNSMKGLLTKLQERAVLDHRLFSVVKPWASASTSARKIMLDFFKDCYMISGFDDESGQASSLSESLVTARLCDSSSTPRQEEVRQKIAFIEASFQFHAVYVIAFEHIGILARLQAVIEALRPAQIRLDVAIGDKEICVSRGLVAEMQRRKTELLSTLDQMRGHVQGLDLTHRYNSSSSLEELERVYESLSSDVKERFPVSPRRVADGCCVSLRLLKEVGTPLKSLCEKDEVEEFSHALVVSSTNDGLFAFAARCIDEIVLSCAFGSVFQSWLPCRPPECAGKGSAWTPVKSDWALLGTEELNPMSLSAVLSANANDVVLESHCYRLKSYFPRKPPIFMSHTSSGHDGTRVFCQRLKDKLQKKLLCTVWFDENELDGSGTSIQEMQVGMRNASFFVICLTPLYLTRPNCLRELRWALDLCSAKDSTKKMIVLPLHPAVSLKGCEDIIKANRDGRPAHVFLPQPVMPSRLEHIKGHKLSAEALELLRRLTRVGSNADWIKLQPWRSDELGEDWEEESVSWAEESPAEVDELLKNGVVADILASMATSYQSADFEFKTYEDEELMSDPPSQDPRTPSDVSAIRSCYPRSQIVFSEKELVSLVHLGLSDVGIMGCVEHGLGKLSVVETETLDGQFVHNPNPLQPTCRLTAHMSGVNFQEAREKWLNYNDMKNIDGHNRDPGLKGDPEHQNFCKALIVLEKAAAGVVPRITSEFASLHSELSTLAMGNKPVGENESEWKKSEHAFDVWQTVLLDIHRNKEPRREEKGGFFVNVPDKNKLWDDLDGPHQIAKVFCAEGAKDMGRIDDLDAPKLFNILQFCSRFPEDVRAAAVHCNSCRNISAHTKKSIRKLAKAEYDRIFKCICKLLECVNDGPSHIALTEIKKLNEEQWQMLNLEVINRMKQENDLLRKQVTFLQGAKSSGSFSLRVLESHMLKAVPDHSSPQRFTCMVNVITGPVRVGMDVSGAAVVAGSVLTSASDFCVGYVSNLSFPENDDGAKSAGAPKLQSDKFASSGDDVLVEVVVKNPQGKTFTFPSLEKEAEAFKQLLTKIKHASSASSDAAAKQSFKKIIEKLENKPYPKLISNDDLELCRKACALRDEECKLLPFNPPSAGGASPAAEKTPSSAKNQVSAKSKSAAAGGGGKSFKPDTLPSDPSPRDAERKLPVALLLDVSASSVSRTESQVPLPTAPTPPQGAAPTSGASAPQALPSSSQAEEDDDWLGVSDEALAKYLS
jgi:GTPase SAR1 family protein